MIRPVTPLRRGSTCLAFLLSAGCGDSGTAADPFYKPSPRVYAAYEGRTMDEWAPRLSDRDPAARRDAVFAIGVFGSEAVGFSAAVVRLLADPDPGVRWAAAIAAERLGVPVLEIHIAQLLADDWDRQEAAAGALAKMGAVAVPALRRVLADERTDTAALAARTLGAIGPVASAAIPDLITNLGRKGTARLAAIEALAAIGVAARSALEAAAQDPDDRVRSAAAAALEALPRR